MRSIGGAVAAWLQHGRVEVGALILLFAAVGVVACGARSRAASEPVPFRRRYILLGLSLVILFALLTWALRLSLLRETDAAVFAALYRRGGPTLTATLLLVCSISGSAGSAAVTLAALVATWTRGMKRLLPFFILVLLGVMGLEMLVSASVARGRPVAADYGYFVYSYPSGDTMLALALAALIRALWLPAARHTWERAAIRCAALIWPPLVAFARIYVGGHFFSDVLAGALLGGAWVSFCFCTAQLPPPEHSPFASPSVRRVKAGELSASRRRK
jgi:undecaprenyl-diphosphatase